MEGDGLRQQFDETFDFDNTVLYLKRGESYNISFIGSDRGGVNTIVWEVQALPPVIEFPDPLPPQWERNISTTPTALNTMRWRGDRAHPVTGHSITTAVIPNGVTTHAVEEIEMLFLVEDFHFNTLRKFLTLRIYNEAPRIGPR
ncbi:MAG: hypothetical protein CL605_06390 [Altibacter sp.]|nr:hypothetical protein [Altibacter sp.]